MSSSRSDDVTNSVCLCVVILLSLEILKYLKLDVDRVFQVCPMGVSKVFKGNFKIVSRMFKGCFNHPASVPSSGYVHPFYHLRCLKLDFTLQKIKLIHSLSRALVMLSL